MKTTPDIRTMLIVGFASGMRFAELSALEWPDVDLTAGTIRIERSQVGGHVGAPKTESTRRLVYLPAPVVEALRRHRHWQEAETQPRLVAKLEGRQLLFPSRTGTYRFPAVLKRPLEECCRAAGISKRLTAHCMRKTANNLIRQSMGEVVARAMVGQATSEMTFRYSEVDASERARANEAAFGDAFSSNGLSN